MRSTNTTEEYALFMNFEPRNGKVRRVLTLTDPVIWRSNDGVIEVALADVTGLSASRHGYPNA